MNYIFFLKIIFGISLLIAIYAIMRNLDIIKIILIYLKDKLLEKVILSNFLFLFYYYFFFEAKIQA